jgi:serine protein kinase
MSTPPVRDQLRTLGESIHGGFAQNRRVMSFAEYLELATSQPHLQLRSSSQYIVDAFDHFGTEQVEYPWGKIRRFRLFDVPWDQGRERLIGQEGVQNRVYRAVQNFVRDGAPNKLVLLHGPNGSAKSTFVRCLGRALEHYSQLEEGALYRINWIFPAQKSGRTGIGFGGAGESNGGLDTFAYLPDELIDAKLGDELRDHPLFLVPEEQRAILIEQMLGSPANARGAEFVLSDYLSQGRLSHKNRAIYEALLSSYHGDYLRVLRHVQVERFYIQQRYRMGYVTVEPQLSVDAAERQITADRSLSALPVALQSVSLFEYGGELVNANRGMIEFSDLLKRPLEAYKYLLTTVERASVSMASAILFLDTVFIGSSNEIHLAAFRELADWQSFKGRIELVRVPYLLDVTQEQKLYEQKVREAAGTRHVAPHCAYVAALWAVLTRMRKPQADRYPSAVSDLVARLTPIEKAELYAFGHAPGWANANQTKELVARVSDLWTESDAYPNYEGRTGASPREMQVVLLNAANSIKYPYVSPLGVIDEILELIKQVSLYDFLKQDTQPGGFHDHKKFVELTRERLIDRIDEEIKSALGLVEESEYGRIFDRYVSHVTHFIKKEKVRNPMSGRMEDPDEPFMRDVEKALEVGGKAEEFRGSVIAKIGAWSLDHPREKPSYSVIFPDFIKKLRESYFDKQKKEIARGVHDLMTLLGGGESSLAPEAQKSARRTLDNLVQRFGYNEQSARDLVAIVLRARYPM